MEATGLSQHLVSKLASTFKIGAGLSKGKTGAERIFKKGCVHIQNLKLKLGKLMSTSFFLTR